MNESLNEIILSKDGKLDVSKVISWCIDTLGYILVPVKGQYNTYWFSGKNVRDGQYSKRMYMVDGPKYYKLVYGPKGIRIVCNGDCNAYHMKIRIGQDIKEAMDAKKAEQAA